MREATVNCHAKINLGLLIGARLPDGYHELRTVFQTIGLHDELRIQAGERTGKTAVELSCTVAELAGEENLAARAAVMVLDELKTRRQLRLALTKNIPAGGGLGGGSSDAAAVLAHLPALLGKKLDAERRWELAARLGADVPFFLVGGRAVGLGRGDEVYPLPDPPSSAVLLIHPGLHVSTADAYRRLDALRGASASAGGPAAAGLTTRLLAPMISYSCGFNWGCGVRRLKNDFEPVVFSACPELARLKAVLARAGASPALLTGSGGAMFGMFGSGAAARQAAAEVRRRWPHWRLWITRTVTRRQLAPRA